MSNPVAFSKTQIEVLAAMNEHGALRYTRAGWVAVATGVKVRVNGNAVRALYKAGAVSSDANSAVMGPYRLAK